MSALKINSKLSEIDSNLDKIDSVVKEGKRKIADAIRFNDIVEVLPNDSSTNDFETFSKYAELIMSIKTRTSPMKLVYTIDSKRINKDALATDLKRTVFLPINMSRISGLNLVTCYKRILNNDKGTYSVSNASNAKRNVIFKNAEEETNEKQIIEDSYGNLIYNGLYFNIEDSKQYLSHSQIDELNQKIETLKTLKTVARQQAATTSITSDYDYIVDWGDGTANQFVSTNTLEENYSAIYHTYKKEGTYLVKVYGIFKYLRSNDHNDNIAIVSDGNYLYDKDSLRLNDGNYSLYYYLSEVRSFGNLGFVSIAYGFAYCGYLTKLPSDLTAQPFKNVYDADSAFLGCGRLKNIPYDSNLQLGLFSNCKYLTNVGYAFELIGSSYSNLQLEIPQKLLDGCENCTSIAGLFYLVKLKAPLDENGNPYLPSDLFKGMKNLTNASSLFWGSGLNCDISNCTLFKDAQKLQQVKSLFYSCNIYGTINKDFFPVMLDDNGNEDLTKSNNIFNCSNAFAKTKIEHIDPEAFRFFKNTQRAGLGTRFSGMFLNSGKLQEIPEGLLDCISLNSFCDIMFCGCSGLKTIPKDSLKNLKIARAQSMFANCNSLNIESIEENSEWSDERYIKKWQGLFANDSSLPFYDSLAYELGGNGSRRFSDNTVGSIVLKDHTLVEPKDYSYDANNVPIGVVYCDEYITSSDPKNIEPNATLNKSLGTRIISACALNDSYNLAILKDSIYAKDVSTLKYDDRYYYDNRLLFCKIEDNKQTLNARFNGPAFTNAFRQFIFESGFYDAAVNFKFETPKDSFETYSIIDDLDVVENISSTNLYFKKQDEFTYTAYTSSNEELVENSSYNVDIRTMSSTQYEAISYLNNYKFGHSVEKSSFIADIGDIYIISYIFPTIQKCLNTIIDNVHFTSKNCYVIPDYMNVLCGTFISKLNFEILHPIINNTTPQDWPISYKSFPIRPCFQV